MALWLLILNGTLLAGVYACAKIAGADGISPLGVLAWQLPAATLLVAIAARALGQWPAVTRANVRYATTAGLLGVTLPSLITFSALRYVPPGTIGVIGALSRVHVPDRHGALGAFELQRRAGPVLTGQLGSVIAVASLAIGVFAFDERYGPLAVAAVLVVFAGIGFVTSGAARAPAPRR